MTRRLTVARPLVWLVFAVLVGVPSLQLTRLLRAKRVAPRAVVEIAPAPLAVEPPPAPPSPSGDREPFRYEPIGPAKAPIAAAVISTTGRLVAVLDDSGEATIWDVREGKRVGTIDSKQRLPMQRYLNGVPMSIEEPLGLGKDAAALAIGGNDGQFRVWHAQTGARLVTGLHSAKDATKPSLKDAPLVDADISTEGALLSVSSNGSLALWTGRHSSGDSALVWMTRSPGGRVRDVDISADARAVAVASDDALYLLNPRPGQQQWTAIDVPTDEPARRGRTSPQQVRFSPGGGILASVWSDGEIRIYSMVTREWVRSMPFGREGPWRRLVAFSPDGQLLAVTDGGRVIQIWAMRSGSSPVALTAPRGAVRSLWFTADGESVVIASWGDRYLRALPLPGAP